MMQLFKKSNVINYMQKYNAYKLPYTKHIRITMQLHNN